MSVDQPTPDVKRQTATRDAFLGDRLWIEQPATGFRAGVDSVLLGASVNGASGELLDMGCGTGVAGLVALSGSPALAGTFADKSEAAIAMCTRNLSANAHGRGRAVCCDVTDGAAVREAAGILANRFDVVIANPPYFHWLTATPPHDPDVASAHFHNNQALDLWVRAAVTAARAGAEIVFIHRAEALSRMLASFAKRLGAIRILPVCPAPGMPASRILMRGTKGSRAPLSLLPALALHEHEGGPFTEPVNSILRGKSRLDW